MLFNFYDFLHNDTSALVSTRKIVFVEISVAEMLGARHKVRGQVKKEGRWENRKSDIRCGSRLFCNCRSGYATGGSARRVTFAAAEGV
jgi:hypothetical protein